MIVQTSSRAELAVWMLYGKLCAPSVHQENSNAKSDTICGLLLLLPLLLP